MHISRRRFLHSVSLGTAAGVLVPVSLPGVSNVSVLQSVQPKKIGKFIQLNHNENAYGPSSKTLKSIQAAVPMANRYVHHYELAARIARFHGVRPSQVLLGCGSTEIMRMAVQAFLGYGKELVQAAPTFHAPESYAKLIGAKVRLVPLTAEFAHDLDGMSGTGSGAPDLVYICNPNNPTASITPRKNLEDFLGQLPPTTYVLIDEAYHHYAQQSSRYVSFLDQPFNDERVIVMRTFSIVYGLAGLRLGYAIASPATLKRMRPFATLDNVNGMVARAAIAALEDQQAIEECVRRNANDRQEFFNQAVARMLKPIDSHTNFVMMNAHHSAAEVTGHFRRNKILIGQRFPAMDTYIRVSLGTPSEMRAFWRAWDLLPYANMHHH
ncbi:MAG: histidinol-phosphate aminotransferase family protein [Acidobacteriia bacterium]|nr:histidinol-phosphate aminotransferase family protein [Terriglobia bacterium]